MNPDAPDSLLSTQPPEFTESDAARIALQHYGLDCIASPLYSERDQNFRLRTRDGAQFVLKIANHLEDPAVIDFQTRALEHIAAHDPALPVPRTLDSRAGRSSIEVEDTDGRAHIVRLISWLDGVIIEESGVPDQLLGQMGAMLARLGLALRDFRHPASHHELIWDLKHAGELDSLLGYIENAALRGLLVKALDRFRQHVTPRLGTLRAQVIHADLNRANMLISEDEPRRVTGIIDFGDMVYSPLVMDLAIGAAYHLLDHGDPLPRALRFIRGYHGQVPLLPVESEILIDLMIGRLCTSITVQMWRSNLYPDNKEYLLLHNSFSRRTLEHVMKFSRSELAGRIVEACHGDAT